MAILNYTTKVDPAKTAMEIQRALSRHAATVTTEYANGIPSAVLFTIMLAGQRVNFRLPCNVEGVRKALIRDRVPRAFWTTEHATRVAWRIVKDWIEAQIAIVDAQQAQMAEVFLPYVVMGDSDTTLFQWFENRQQLLTSGADQPSDAG